MQGSLDGVEIAQQGLQGLVDENEVQLREQLLNIAAELEAKMDYPQEDLSFESDEEIVDTLSTIAQNARLASDSYQQNRIRFMEQKSPF